MWPEDESQGLYVAPAVPNAVEWSEDNLLAVVTGPAAVIFNPCQLSGNQLALDAVCLCCDVIVFPALISQPIAWEQH